jgi:hypothetical protein
MGQCVPRSPQSGLLEQRQRVALEGAHVLDIACSLVPTSGAPPQPPMKCTFIARSTSGERPWLLIPIVSTRLVAASQSPFS